MRPLFSSRNLRREPCLPSIPGIGGGGSSAGDPDAFLAKAKASEILVNKRADQLFNLIASKEEQAKIEEQRQKINATSDEKEKDAMTMKWRAVSVRLLTLPPRTRTFRQRPKTGMHRRKNWQQPLCSISL